MGLLINLFRGAFVGQNSYKTGCTASFQNLQALTPTAHIENIENVVIKKVAAKHLDSARKNK